MRWVIAELTQDMSEMKLTLANQGSGDLYDLKSNLDAKKAQCCLFRADLLIHDINMDINVVKFIMFIW